MKVTYGVYGMMEWVALIPMRHNLVRVRFSGGSLSGFGTTPATFTTDNPVVIRMIEQSSYFRRGKIRRVATEEAAEESCSEVSKESGQPGYAGGVTFKKKTGNEGNNR